VLSDVYYPTIESSNVKTVQYIVTDGKTFADLQERDMTYTVSSPDRSGMVCQVTSTDAKHGFQIVTDYITDPARDSVVMRSKLVPLPGGQSNFSNLKVYVRYNPHIDNTGGGGSANGGANNASVDPSTTALVATDTQPAAGPGPFAATVYGALAANQPFLAESSGFAGTPSDGLSQLDASYGLADQYQSAQDGNVTLTALVDAAPGQRFTLALGFGASARAAIGTAEQSAAQPFAETLAGYVAGWRGYDKTLHQPPARLPGLSAAEDAAMQSQYWLSANVLKADEDKTYPGAFVASPTDPWGQSVPAMTTHPGWTYREVFTRDSYETFTGLLADGDMASARAIVQFLYDRTQQPDGSFPRDSLLNGAVAPDTFGLVEIDEDAYPLLMAWEAGFAGNVSFYRDHIRPDADFIVDHGPAYGVERWEEHPGFSPSTIAAEIAGLAAAAQLAQAAGDPARARLYLATADEYQRNVERWTVTTTGPYGPGYFIRLSPTGEPNADETYDLGNGSLSNVDQRDVVDAGFLELTRLGELSPSDPAVQESLPVVDSVLESQTASGPGWHRYGVKAGLLGQAAGSTDGYGDCYVPDPTSCSPTGAPWYPTGTGSGHLWPLLDGERAEQDLQAGDVSGAASLTAAMQRMSSGLGLVPEQAWEDPDDPASPYGSDPETASIGFTNGEAAGSAAPLIWAQAQYLRLVLDLQAGHLLDQPAITRSRYVTSGPPGTVPLGITLTAPGAVATPATTSTTAPGVTQDVLASQEPGLITTATQATVSGKTAPGAAVDIAASQPGSPANTTAVAQTVAGSDGRFQAAVATPPGQTIVTVTATAGDHATGWAQQTVTGAYTALSAGYDNVGVTSESNTSPGNFDGAGDSYSAQALAAGTPNALAPGTQVTADGVTMTWPDVAAGQPDNVVAGGQAFQLTGTGTTLGFLGAADFGTATGTGTITYTDGTSQQYPLSFSDWASSTAAPGTSIVNTTTRWNTPSGPNGANGVRNVYFASVPLQAGKTVAFVTLPDISSGVGIFTAMHIFAIAVGG
jgi:glucan 1,4-alpha-glucosidase